MENSALLKAIIDNAIDGIITIDDRGTIERINPAGYILFGYAPEEAIGKNISKLIPSPETEDDDYYLTKYTKIGKASLNGKGRELIGLHKSGSTFPLRLGISEVQFSGRKIYTGFIHDLSQEKQAEEKLQEYASHLEEQVEIRTQMLNESIKALQISKEKVSESLEKEKELGQLKSRFVSMASHEFRTPLSSIQLSAILVEKYVQTEDQTNVSKYIGKIKNSVSSLTSILNDFLSLERLEDGKVDILLNDTNIQKFGEEITEEMQMISKQDQNIIYEHTGPKHFAKLDQALLKNCIINLISNAIKYSGENTFIEFNTMITETELTVIVKDNGIGIPENDQKHLFEPFFRAHNTGNIPGTGLGLNIVARYTELMNGRIHFESKVDKGASFTLIFPINHE